MHGLLKVKSNALLTNIVFYSYIIILQMPIVVSVDHVYASMHTCVLFNSNYRIKEKKLGKIEETNSKCDFRIFPEKIELRFQSLQFLKLKMHTNKEHKSFLVTIFIIQTEYMIV